MTKLINCECGRTFRGETTEEVIKQAEEHIRESHPRLVGTVSLEELVVWIEDE